MDLQIVPGFSYKLVQTVLSLKSNLLSVIKKHESCTKTKDYVTPKILFDQTRNLNKTTQAITKNHQNS